MVPPLTIFHPYNHITIHNSLVILSAYHTIRIIDDGIVVFSFGNRYNKERLFREEAVVWNYK